MKINKENKWQIIIVTGMSGAGKSTVLKSFEDFGFETFDNIPLSLVRYLISEEQQKKEDENQLSLLKSLANPENKNSKKLRPLAIGIDIRTRDFGVKPLYHFFEMLKENPNIENHLIFMDCEDTVLQRRFTETRRKHPLAQDRRLEDGIEQERKIMSSIKEIANTIIDTSETSPSEIKNYIESNFIKDKDAALKIFVTSFSYRYGIPRNADLVFDVRFLKNPHYVSELKKLTGNDEKVGEYIANDAIYDTFFKGLTNFIEPLLPRYISEGKSYLTIAFGCTGGQHRSVFVANELKKWLAKKEIIVNLKHRELEHILIKERL
ncbi:MAG: RNase adapter RapZ [Alphaproteobacteria bacterium]